MEIIELLRGDEVSLLFIALFAFTIGALHSLETGHSKTMIAAFIVATRGTVYQAIILVSLRPFPIVLLSGYFRWSPFMVTTLLVRNLSHT